MTRPVRRLVPFRAAALAALLALMAACSVPPPSAVPGAPPSPPSDHAFDRLLAGQAAGPVLRIGDEALIAATVRRGGALARLGHDHVVAARRIDGRVAPQAGLAVLRFRLDEMTVDEPALRQEAGLTTQPSSEAIAGTRTNMLTKVLDAERYPFVEVRAMRLPGDTIQADITLHGVTRRYLVPVTVRTLPGGALAAHGTLALKQTDFGLVPFSVLGGALAVQDELALRFTLPASAREAVR